MAGGTLVRASDNPAHSLVRDQMDAIADILPRTMRPEAFARVALSAARDDKVARAIERSPDMFVVALLNAARLGLDPGTEEYYLVPFENNRLIDGEWQKIPEVQGIPGYQGLIKMMYRGKIVVAVHADIVYPNDVFAYVQGADAAPRHEGDWFASAYQRGVRKGRPAGTNGPDDKGEDAVPPRGAYAYAEMVTPDGGRAFSKVVMLPWDMIERRKRLSKSAFKKEKRNGEYVLVPNPNSPWYKHPEAMVIKTPCRDLRKFVPISAEYADHLRAGLVRASQAAEKAGIDPAQLGSPENPENVPGEYEGEAEDHPFNEDPKQPDRCIQCKGYRDDPWHVGEVVT